MALNTSEMWFNGIKIAFFLQKTYKKSPNGWGLRPQAPKASGGRGLRSRPSSVLRLRYTTFINTSPKLDICIFQLLLKALFLCKILLKCQSATISDLPSYDILVPQKVPLLKILMTSLHVICGVGLPTKQKFWPRLEIGDCLKKFLKTVFLENTCGCVLGPWPWPRAFLSLASRGSVLEKPVLGLASDFFCVLGLGLGLEPCVLDSTSGTYRDIPGQIFPLFVDFCPLKTWSRNQASPNSILIKPLLALMFFLNFSFPLVVVLGL